MTVLVLAEHDGRVLRPAVAHAVTAAKAIGGGVHLLIAGSDAGAVAEAAAHIDGVSAVLLADAPHLAHPLPENLAPIAVELVRDRGYGTVAAAATAFGKNVLPRIAALLDVAAVSDITAVRAPNTFERPIYAGNAVATVKTGDPIVAVTVRPTAFEAAGTGESAAPVERIDAGEPSAIARFVSEDLIVTGRPELTQAKVVVAGGRGLQSKDNFALLERLADLLGGAVGATRAAVDAGYIANDAQVGQTGKVVAPELYIGVGLSGAIQHVAGIKDSRVIVAINQDEEAPIFQVADYALVADLFTAVPELIAALEPAKA
jgi:electron transfer flavoprotein alpha subunit